jgi:hypothetical protein
MRVLYIFFSILFSLFSRQTFSQECDVIVLKTGEEITSQVLEIRLSEIAYKKCDFTSGPTYVLLKTDVFMIKYKNGQKELIGTENVATQSTVVPQSEKQYLENIFSAKTKGDQKAYWETTCFQLYKMDGTLLKVKLYHYSVKQCIFKPCDDSFDRFAFATEDLNYIEDEQHMRFYFNTEF